jgi:serine/threonine protein phosphatase PrpC
MPHHESSEPPVVVLWGDDHPTLGEMTVASLDDRCAIGLSAGRLPKPYWHLDPNEDVALAMGTTGLRVLAVADGHNGADAARAAIAAIRDAAPPLLVPGAHAAELLAHLIDRAAAAVSAAVASADSTRSGSRTALSIAVLDGHRLHAATFGDTVIARVRGGKAKRVTGESPFLGPTATRPSADSVKLRRGDAVVLSSDGVTDYLGSRPLERLGAVLQEIDDPAQAVRDLMGFATAGGAGDHLGVALALM